MAYLYSSPHLLRKAAAILHNQCRRVVTQRVSSPVTETNTSCFNFVLHRTFTNNTQCIKPHQCYTRRNIFSRLFSGGKTKRAQGKLPFEVDSNVVKDTILFTYNNDRFYRMVSIFGFVQFLFWANLAAFSYSSLGALTGSKDEGQQRSWWEKVVTMQSNNTGRITFLCVSIGLVVMFFTWIYPQRAINTLTLLRGGREVRIVTYSHFGRKKEFVTPLESINCLQLRTSKASQVSLKVKGRWFYFLMDKQQGQFYNTGLFDYVVGLKRKL